MFSFWGQITYSVGGSLNPRFDFGAIDLVVMAYLYEDDRPWGWDSLAATVAQSAPR